MSRSSSIRALTAAAATLESQQAQRDPRTVAWPAHDVSVVNEGTVQEHLRELDLVGHVADTAHLGAMLAQRDKEKAQALGPALRRVGPYQGEHPVRRGACCLPNLLSGHTPALAVPD